jgi:hypothetical protein
LSVLIATGIAGLGEVFQAWTGRSGELDDFVRGALGALAAVAGIRAWQLRGRPLPVSGCLVVLAGLVAWPLYDAVPTLVDAFEGAHDFPVLADFRTGRQLLRWTCRQATLTSAGRVEFLPGPEAYPYVGLRPVRRDFRAYRWLCCSFTVEGEPLELVLSVRSGPGLWTETTHYQQQRVHPAGEHLVRLDLAAIAPKARPYPLDQSDVLIIQFFLDHPAKARALTLHGIWLEE